MEPSAESPFGSRAYQRAARESAGTMVLRTVEVSSQHEGWREGRRGRGEEEGGKWRARGSLRGR